jgi:hypothetical protein
VAATDAVVVMLGTGALLALKLLTADGWMEVLRALTTTTACGAAEAGVGAGGRELHVQ